MKFKTVSIALGWTSGLKEFPLGYSLWALVIVWDRLEKFHRGAELFKRRANGLFGCGGFGVGFVATFRSPVPSLGRAAVEYGRASMRA